MIELTLDYEKAYLTNLSCHVNWRLSLFALCVHFSLRRCQNEPQATVRLRTAGGNVKRGLKSKMYHLAFQLPDLPSHLSLGVCDGESRRSLLHEQ